MKKIEVFSKKLGRFLPIPIPVSGENILLGWSNDSTPNTGGWSDKGWNNTSGGWTKSGWANTSGNWLDKGWNNSGRVWVDKGWNNSSSNWSDKGWSNSK